MVALIDLIFSSTAMLVNLRSPAFGRRLSNFAGLNQVGLKPIPIPAVVIPLTFIKLRRVIIIVGS